MTIGQKLSPILEEIEATIIDFEAYQATKPGYTKEGFRGAVKIFMSAILDKMWELQVNEEICQSDRESMAVSCGEELRRFVKTYTGIDTFDLYNNQDLQGY